MSSTACRTLFTACFEGLSLAAINVGLFLCLMGLREYMAANFDDINALLRVPANGANNEENGAPADAGGAPPGTALPWGRRLHVTTQRMPRLLMWRTRMPVCFGLS